MNFTDFTNSPRFPDFWNVVKDMSPQDFANFSMWCWINNAVPNPTTMNRWLNAKINTQK